MTTKAMSTSHGTGIARQVQLGRKVHEGRDALEQNVGEEQSEDDRDRGTGDSASAGLRVGLGVCHNCLVAHAISPHTIGHGNSSSTPSASQPKRNRVVHSRVR